MGVKISELAEKTTANSSDVIPVVDTGTKKNEIIHIAKLSISNWINIRYTNKY